MIMTAIEIAGTVVVGLGSLMTLLAVTMKLIFDPVNKLTVSVTQLVSALDGMTVSHGKLETKVDIHDTRLDGVELKLARNAIQ